MTTTLCPCCKFPIEVHEQPGYSSRYCSEFCAVVSDEDKAKLAKLQPGEYGLWPCPDCGCVVDDVYDPNDCCGACGEKRRLANTAFEVIKRNIQAKLDTLGGSGMTLEGGLHLVLRDLEAFRKLTPRKLKALLQ